MTHTAPTVRDILTDPACSRWMAQALRSALDRDPVDAANDAAVLARVLDARARFLLSHVERIPTLLPGVEYESEGA